MGLSASNKRTKTVGNAKGKSKVPLPSERPRNSPSPSPSGSSSNDNDNTDGDDERAAMLAALEAHGRAMFGLAAPSEQAESSEQGRRRLGNPVRSSTDREEDGDSEEEGGEGFSSDDGWGAEDDFVSDSEDEMLPTAQVTVPPASRKVTEVVFDDSTGRSSDTTLSKAERKAFLMGDSAKIMGLQKELEYGVGRKRARDEGEDLEDQSNLKLDKTLHDMLLTNLLPSAAADSASRPVHKRNAMNGRLLELASYQLPGEGAKHVSSAVLSSHPAEIKTGIRKAQAKREAAQREEDRASGSWVKGLGGLGDGGRKGPKGPLERRAAIGVETGKKRGLQGRKKGDGDRARGLGIGVGRFEGGVLKLTERDAARAMGGGSGSGSGGRGDRGGFKGKKGKRR